MGFRGGPAPVRRRHGAEQRAQPARGGQLRVPIRSFTQILVRGASKPSGGGKIAAAHRQAAPPIFVCGNGRFGSIAVREIVRWACPWSAWRWRTPWWPRMVDDDVLFVHGDATDDDVLRRRHRAGQIAHRGLSSRRQRQLDPHSAADEPGLLIVARRQRGVAHPPPGARRPTRHSCRTTMGGVWHGQSVIRPGDELLDDDGRGPTAGPGPWRDAHLVRSGLRGYHHRFQNLQRFTSSSSPSSAPTGRCSSNPPATLEMQPGHLDGRGRRRSLQGLWKSPAAPRGRRAWGARA